MSPLSVIVLEFQYRQGRSFEIGGPTLLLLTGP